MLFRSNDTATTEIYTLSLHDALPISIRQTASTVRWVAVAATQSSPGARWIGRTSIMSPARAGQRRTHCTASSFEEAWMTQ